MKALELTVYPKFDHDWKISKRFTDAELAAEVFRQAAWIGAGGRAYRTDAGRNIVFDAAFTFGPVTRDEHEWLTMNSFAMLPHYDQEEATV